MPRKTKAKDAAAERDRTVERGATKAAKAREERIRSASFSRKLDRAGDHIEALGKLAQDWLGGDAYRLLAETNPETQRTVIRAKVSEPPPPAIALITGDAVHNLRSALDHLALELAIANHRPKSLPAQIEKASEFPIFPQMVGTSTGSDAFHRVKTKTGDPVPGSGLHKLQGVHADAIQVIEGIQPYRRGSAYAEDPLWVIHELDRIDKHRRPHLTAYAMGGVGIGGNGYIGHLHMDKAGHNGPVEDGTEVAVFTVHNSHFQMNFAREITLAEPTLPLPAGDQLVGMLAGLRDYVRDAVILALTPFL